MADVMSDSKQLNVDSIIDDSGSDSSRLVDPEAERRLLRKCDIHVIPILWILYATSFLDRINLGNAKIEGLEKDLHMTGNDYNVATLMFFVPYILLEVPSNVLLKRVAPSTWLSLLMVLWGIITVCQGLTQSYAGLVVCRVLLGTFEAGFFPGSIYLISMYYKRHEFQRRYTVFFTSGLVAGAFGGLLAFALAKMKGLGGYNGWRWIFIIEGLFTIVLGAISKLLIPDWPEQAKFLNSEEKALLARRLQNDGGPAQMNVLNRQSLMLVLKDWKIWTGTLIYVCMATSSYSTAFFIPTILNEFGYSASEAQIHTIPVYAVTTVVTLAAAWGTDRLRHRYAFTMAGITLAAIGYIILLCQGGPKDGLSVGVKYMAVFFVVVGIYITQPISIVWLSNNMGGHYKRAFGAAMQIGIGNCGGIIGSTVYLAKQAPKYPAGYGTALGMLLFGGILCTGFFLGLRAENKKRDRGERDYRLELPKEQLENLGDDHPEFRFTL
ncbi:MAG: hypothetical protein M1827_003634 [Pycnora praestabilis]|nr:MAG: hypothetical protein M1827_003634 [Pycnora praestabilis]